MWEHGNIGQPWKGTREQAPLSPGRPSVTGKKDSYIVHRLLSLMGYFELTNWEAPSWPNSLTGRALIPFRPEFFKPSFTVA